MSAPRITDVCLVTRDLEAATRFYVDKLQFEVASENTGFIDFHGPNVTLALWDGQAIRDSTGVPALTDDASAHGVMVAVELASPAEIDAKHRELVTRDVEFYGPPRDYPWNARAIYFAGPCGEFWEFYAWLPGGKHG